MISGRGRIKKVKGIETIKCTDINQKENGCFRLPNDPTNSPKKLKETKGTRSNVEMEWRLSTLGTGRAWTAGELVPRARDFKLPHTDSGQNSLEYWDYSVELEMLKGPEDLQLAAELGKTLLERNRELESNIKQQNAVIEDQLQEIEYLSKQTAALREVNDSRLRIYEQLEISIQELEKNNQRLSAESAADKKKIKNLCSTLESLEARCDELQRSLEEARSGAQQQQRGRNKRRSLILDEQNLRRSHSCENTPQEEAPCTVFQNSEERTAEELEARSKIEELQDKMKLLQKEKESEIRKKEELEIQLACMSQENAVLNDQLMILREKEVNLRSFDEELASLDDASSGRLCRKCLGNVDETASNPTIYDLQDSIEDTDVSIESIHGECALVRLKNGGYAWGSQESLASIGQVMSHMGSEGTSPGTEASDAPHNSLLSELDTSYRILIEKYEALLEAREQQQQQQQQQQHVNQDEGLVHPGVDDMSGPMSLVMTDSLHDTSAITLKCQRCHTCTCDMKPGVTRPKSNMEEFSEVETSSSGFSDGESRLSNKSTQTGEEVFSHKEILEDLTPTIASRCLDLSSPVNPCDKRFQTAPEYKKLFQEIFTVLKQTVDEKDAKSQPGKPAKAQQLVEADKNAHNSKTSGVKSEDNESITETSTTIEVTEVTEVKTVKTIVNSEIQNVANEKKAEVARETPSIEHEDKQKANREEVRGREERRPEILDDQHVPEEQRVTHKPPRPDSLDLGGGSRPTSRQKRRSRYRNRLDSYQQHQQYMGQYQYSHGSSGNESHPSGHRHHKRERDHSQNHHRNQDDFPTLRTDENEHSKTRIIYNSSRSRCEHHRSRKHRGRSSNRQRHGQHHLSAGQDQQPGANQNQANSEGEPRGRAAPPKINYPSVEVAKLRKLEMSYAEVLKTSFNRSHYNHRRY
ncbi:nuclear mitotic apparatus protein 1-like [Penaeus monodon]|uniref:nuclear mitotic apparatus protein 1-like n=1 Tax=Penaeus monodon TaxID=6687 RepID=UPI0018A6F9AB|nr:nuclear mitotic apparatus protein 1-like [Penaeus monodon]